MKKSILTFVLALLVAVPLSVLNGNVAQAGAFLSANTAIRGESAITVYWYANDGKRYVFPNAATYFTWFPSFDTVRTVSDADLIAIPLGGNVTYRPGTKLVKVNTDPRTYAVAKGGVLRHVTNESLASQLYGADWRSDVHDIPDVYFTNYTVGTPIYNTWDYNVSNEYNGVSTPSDSLRVTNGGTQTGDLVLNASRTSINPGEAVTLSITNVSSYGSGYRIEIYDTRTNGLIRTCSLPMSTCEITVYPQRNSTENTVQYYAALRNTNSTTLKSGYSPVINFGGANTSNDLTILTDKTLINSGDAITVSARSSDTFNVSRIDVYDERDNNLVFTCYDVQNCSQSRTFFRRNTSENTFRLYAQLKDWNGTVLRTAYTPTISFNGSSTGNRLSLVANRTDVTNGETITLTATGNGSLSSPRINIINQATRTLVANCSGNTCSQNVTITGTNSQSVRFTADWIDGANGMVVDTAEVTIYISYGTSNCTSLDCVNPNFINGLVLNADRTNINAGDLVRLTANAFNTGTWSYTGNRIDIVDAHRGTIVKTCYDVSTCTFDVYPQAQASTNLTAQYQARIYDRHGMLAMSQYSPVIYLTSYNGSNNGSNGNSSIGTGAITFAPTDALHPNKNIYLTATFIDSNIPMYDAQVRIYTEQSSTPIATCNGAYTCSVSYPTGSSPMTTRTYGQLSNRFNIGTFVETPRVNLTTTW